MLGGIRDTFRCAGFLCLFGGVDHRPLGFLTNFATLRFACSVGWPSLKQCPCTRVIENPKDVAVGKSISNDLQVSEYVSGKLYLPNLAQQTRFGTRGLFSLPLGASLEPPSRLSVLFDDRRSFLSSSLYLRWKVHTFSLEEFVDSLKIVRFLSEASDSLVRSSLFSRCAFRSSDVSRLAGAGTTAGTVLGTSFNDHVEGSQSRSPRLKKVLLDPSGPRRDGNVRSLPLRPLV